MPVDTTSAQTSDLALEALTANGHPRCQALTLKHKQCSRATKDGGDYCWQHVGSSALAKEVRTPSSSLQGAVQRAPNSGRSKPAGGRDPSGNSGSSSSSSSSSSSGTAAKAANNASSSSSWEVVSGSRSAAASPAASEPEAAAPKYKPPQLRSQPSSAAAGTALGQARSQLPNGSSAPAAIGQSSSGSQHGAQRESRSSAGSVTSQESAASSPSVGKVVAATHGRASVTLALLLANGKPRCQAIAKSTQLQCSRRATHNNLTRCWQHGMPSHAAVAPPPALPPASSNTMASSGGGSGGGSSSTAAGAGAPSGLSWREFFLLRYAELGMQGSRRRQLLQDVVGMGDAALERIWQAPTPSETNGSGNGRGFIVVYCQEGDYSPATKDTGPLGLKVTHTKRAVEVHMADKQRKEGLRYQVLARFPTNFRYTVIAAANRHLQQFAQLRSAGSHEVNAPYLTTLAQAQAAIESTISLVEFEHGDLAAQTGACRDRACYRAVQDVVVVICFSQMQMAQGPVL